MFFRRRIGIVLVEDEQLTAHLTGEAVRQLRGCDLLGIAHTATAARTLIAAHRPRLVLMDWKLPDGDGIALIGELAHLYPATRWLVLSAYQCAEFMEAADSVGAHGVLDKMTADRGDLLRAIEQIAAGGDYYCPASSRLMRATLALPESRHLTDRQREILKRLARAQSRPEIAAALGCTQGSLTTQIARLARKLGFDSPPALSKIVATAQEIRELPNYPRL